MATSASVDGLDPPGSLARGIAGASTATFGPGRQPRPSGQRRWINGCSTGETACALPGDRQANPCFIWEPVALDPRSTHHSSGECRPPLASLASPGSAPLGISACGAAAIRLHDELASILRASSSTGCDPLLGSPEKAGNDRAIPESSPVASEKAVPVCQAVNGRDKVTSAEDSLPERASAGERCFSAERQKRAPPVRPELGFNLRLSITSKNGEA